MMSCVSSPMLVPRVYKPAGQIQVILGPMFSGKTTELIRRMKRYELANYRCLIVKYANDVRYDKNGVATHDRSVLPATSATSLVSLKKSLLDVDVIGVDEGQFFPDVVEFSEQQANLGKIVIVAGLDATYQRKAFEGMLSLVPLAESVMKLTAVCMTCYGEAAFTKRKGFEKELEVIGGADKYLAVCRKCYLQSPTKSPRPERVTSVCNKDVGSAGRKLFTESTHMQVI